MALAVIWSSRAQIGIVATAFTNGLLRACYGWARSSVPSEGEGATQSAQRGSKPCLPHKDAVASSWGRVTNVRINSEALCKETLPKP